MHAYLSVYFLILSLQRLKFIIHIKIHRNEKLKEKQEEKKISLMPKLMPTSFFWSSSRHRYKDRKKYNKNDENGISFESIKLYLVSRDFQK